MKRRHIISISLILALAAVVGGLAATRTAQLGAAAKAIPVTTSAGIVQRSRQLDRTEAALRRALARKPPALPPLPSAAASNGARPAQRVVYVRPAPIVHVIHRQGGGDDGGEVRDRGGGGDD